MKSSDAINRYSYLNAVEFVDEGLNNITRQIVGFIGKRIEDNIENEQQNDEFTFKVNYVDLLKWRHIEEDLKVLTDISVFTAYCDKFIKAAYYCGYVIMFTPYQVRKQGSHSIIDIVFINVSKTKYWYGKINIDDTETIPALVEGFRDVCNKYYNEHLKYDVADIYELCITDENIAQYNWSKSIVSKFLNKYILINKVNLFQSALIPNSVNYINESEVSNMSETKNTLGTSETSKYHKYSDELHDYSISLFTSKYSPILIEEYKKRNGPVFTSFAKDVIREPFLKDVVDAFADADEVVSRDIKLVKKSIWGWVRTSLLEVKKCIYNDADVTDEMFANYLEGNKATTDEVEVMDEQNVNLTEDNIVPADNLDKQILHSYTVQVGIEHISNGLFKPKKELIQFTNTNVLAEDLDTAWKIVAKMLQGFISSDIGTFRICSKEVTQNDLNYMVV